MTKTGPSNIRLILYFTLIISIKSVPPTQSPPSAKELKKKDDKLEPNCSQKSEKKKKIPNSDVV